MKALRPRWLAVILVIADLPGCQRRRDLEQQGFDQRYQLFLPREGRHDARLVLLEQVRLNACVLVLHCWRSPSLCRIGESLEAHRSRRAEIAEYRATAAARHEAGDAPPIRVSSTPVCRRPTRRAAK